MSELKSPKEDAVIIGTLEVIEGTALIQDARIQDGKIVFEYDGETKVDWDSQKSKLNEDGKVQFVDSEGNYWSEDEVIKANA
jgi:hypothetical protein